MSYIHQKATEDLDFGAILRLTEAYTANPLVKDRIRKAYPQTDRRKVEHDLFRTDEILRALLSGNAFPSSEFEPYGEELAKIRVENYFPEPPFFLALASVTEILTDWRKFLKAFGPDFPHWNDFFSTLNLRPEIGREIRSKIDRSGQIKDTASENLMHIRRAIRETKSRRDREFARAVKTYDQKNYLDDIRESYLDDRPVLAVKAMYRHRVAGNVAGTSRNGSIVFIEPAEIHALTRQIQELLADERAEQVRILRELTAFVRPYAPDLAAYEHFLTEAEFARAKALLAREMDAVLPQITSRRELFLRRAYHPLLLLRNKAKSETTVPQDIHLRDDTRILVISGPNAGGKSITLKTVGLLQLMLQSGWLVPVHPQSRMPFFGKILSDVGDHQSIENELSTYSYRLKNMRLFLRLAAPDTLFLIDEFGTGTDPDLGGALAEVFLEEFQKSGAFGIITTHYNNLKLRAERLPAVLNAYMEFDLRKMQPTYRLQTGQAGSSFTFEVARRMGIPEGIIRRAKQKTGKAKIRLDRTLSQLQTEKKQLREKSLDYDRQIQALKARQKDLDDRNFSLLQKLEQFRQLYEDEKRKTDAGEKILNLFADFTRHGDRKRLYRAIERWLQKEFVKQAKSEPLSGRQKQALKKVKNQITDALQQKDVRKELTRVKIRRMPYRPKPGDRVRVKGSSANATLEEIRGDMAVLNYGRFTARVPLHELELVMRK